MRLMTATSARSTGLELRFCRLSRKLNFSHPRCHHDPRVFYVAEDTSSSTTVASHSYRGPYHKIRIIDIPTPHGFFIQLIARKSCSKPRISIPVYPTLLCLSTQTRRRYTTGLQLQSYNMHPISALDQKFANGINLSVSQTLPNIRRRSAEMLVDKNDAVRHVSKTFTCPSFLYNAAMQHSSLSARRERLRSDILMAAIFPFCPGLSFSYSP